MTVAVDMRRREAAPDEKRPEILRIIIHFVVIHFRSWTQPKPESGKLQEPLTPP
jgi:hypothetical protein